VSDADLETVVAQLTVEHGHSESDDEEVKSAASGLDDEGADRGVDHVTLHLVGRTDVDRGYAARVRARLTAPDLAARVVIHGALPPPDVARLYGSADVFASASHSETYGMVFGEALGAGLPVVGWRTGNLPYLVEDGREGCLVTRGDVAGLARALRRLSTDQPWRAELAGGARRRGRLLPTWNDAADRFFGALTRLAEAHD